MHSTTRPSLAESPWFWAALFGGMGILGVVVIGPKYAVRTARIERMQDTRVRVAAERARNAAGESPTTADSQAKTDSSSAGPQREPYVEADYVPPTKLVWLLGLMVLLLVVGIGGLLATRHRPAVVSDESTNNGNTGGVGS